MSAYSRKKWDCLHREKIKDLDAEAVHLVHSTSDMEFIHIRNSYPEIFASFIFFTPPENSKGIPHILEHLVFCGSEKYRNRDPFINLSSGSVNSFYNAMTYPDKTVFPFASVLKKDFLNLLDVYSDAVFYPLLKREAFLQEGVRLHQGKEGVEAGGIVYNEMLGSYSAHETIASEYSSRLLFSDTWSYYDSGGEPEDILTLKYEELLAYYEKYYRTGNCVFFLYGDIDTGEIQEFLEDRILSGDVRKEFNRRNYSGIRQEKWIARRNFFVPGPPDSGYSASLNWKLGESADTARLMEIELISELLLGNQESPVYKMLIESGLGEDLSAACGLESDGRELIFSIALRGLKKPEFAERFQQIVMQKLGELSDKGVNRESLLSTFEKYEFRKREVRGGYPVGFRLMNRILRTLFTNRNPFSALAFDTLLPAMREKINNDPALFGRLISDLLVNNTHCSLTLIYPHKKYPASESYLAEIAERLYRNCSNEFEQDFSKFEKYALQNDEISAVPFLTLNDIPENIINKTGMDDPGYSSDIDGKEISIMEIVNNGIVYYDFAFSCRNLDAEQKMLLPLFARLLCTSPTVNRSREKLMSDIDELSGGIYAFTESSRIVGTDDCAENFYIRLPVTYSKAGKALELLSDMIFNGRIRNDSFLDYIINEQKNDFLSSVLPNGNIFASLSSAALLDPVIQLEEKWRGLSQYSYLDMIERKSNRIALEMEQIRKRLFRTDNMEVQIGSPKEHVESGMKELRSFIGMFANAGLSGSRKISEQNKNSVQTNFPAWNIFEIDAGTGFCACSFPCPTAEKNGNAENLFTAHYLSSNILWDEIRLGSGAYGAGASVNGIEGIFTFSTFRDPSVDFSISAFRRSIDTLALGIPGKSEIEKNIISLIGEELRPMVPEEKTMMKFRRRLYGISPEIRQRKIRTLLEITDASLRNALEQMKITADSRSAYAVLAGKSKLKSLLKTFEMVPNSWKKLNVL